MDQLGVLKLFVAVADRQSFAEAARELRVSPAAASRAIAKLEALLGTALFRRTTRSVGLTAEGARYFEHCRQALETLEHASRELRGEDASPRGELVVTAPVMFGRLHVLPIVASLLAEHPALTVRLLLMDRVVRLAEEGVDLAIRIAELPDSSLRATRLTETGRILVASPDYLARRGTPARVTDLHDHDLVVFDNVAPNGEWRFGEAGRTALRPEPRLITNSMDAAIDAAVSGSGITRVLSYQVEAHLVAGRLSVVLAGFEPPPVPVSLVYLPNRRGAPNVRAFIAAAKRRFIATGSGD